MLPCSSKKSSSLQARLLHLESVLHTQADSQRATAIAGQRASCTAGPQVARSTHISAPPAAAPPALQQDRSSALHARMAKLAQLPSAQPSSETSNERHLAARPTEPMTTTLSVHDPLLPSQPRHDPSEPDVAGVCHPSMHAAISPSSTPPAASLDAPHPAAVTASDPHSAGASQAAPPVPPPAKRRRKHSAPPLDIAPTSAPPFPSASSCQPAPPPELTSSVLTIPAPVAANHPPGSASAPKPSAPLGSSGPAPTCKGEPSTDVAHQTAAAHQGDQAHAIGRLRMSFSEADGPHSQLQLLHLPRAMASLTACHRRKESSAAAKPRPRKPATAAAAAAADAPTVAPLTPAANATGPLPPSHHQPPLPGSWC
ncbi:MAG: hypothetical protein WDW38_006305 [Sanguina aurantia]